MRSGRAVPTGAAAGDPEALARAEELAVALRRELDGVHDPVEVRARLARFERERGVSSMTTQSSERFVLKPDHAAASSKSAEELRREVEELEEVLESADDPADVRTRAEEFAEEHGWTVTSEASPGDASGP